MKKLLAALLFAVSSFSYSQIVTIPIPGAPGLSVTVGTGVNALPLQDIRNNPNAVNITTSDDWYTEVPLGFTFPMFGQNFTTSWAATNGFVTFQNPQTSGLWGGCCSGIDLRTTTDPRYNYTIYGLHTDLYSWNGQNQYYLREGNSMTYGWYNTSQCCGSQGGNSFEIKINSSGLIDTRIAGAMVQWNAVTSGFAGDLSKGEYYQHYHGQGLNITPGSSNIFSWQALGGTGTGVDQCTINPLYSPSCPGYAAAYTAQQCTISALYDPSCPGYQQAYFFQQCTLNSLYNQSCPGYQEAYFTQQCSANPLYNSSCPGYQQAYFNQQCSLSALYSPQCPGYEQANFNLQCSLNPLYNSGCPGYQQAYFNQQCTANPLYNSGCPGYQQAYFNQQCTANPLYNSQCPGYGQAYFNQQCSLNPLYNSQCVGYSEAYHQQQCSLNPLYATTCSGYQQAYFNQQCSLNPLYNSGCPGYQEAYFNQQCTANPLYNLACPGYQQAYFNQQCSLNTLYNSACPGYESAYRAYLTAQACTANPQSSPTCLGYVTPTVSNPTKTNNTTTEVVAVSSTGTVNTTPAVVADPVVNRVVTSTSTSTAPTAPAAPVQLTNTSSSQQTTTTLVEASATQSSSSSSSESSKSSSSTSASTSSSSSSSPSTQSPRQTLQQARVEAAKRQAVAKGMEAVKESGEAKSMDGQVATQGLVIAAMGFSPAFDAYNNVVMKDASFYKPFTIYGGQKNVDNARAGRRLFGATDQLHNQMVQSQYELGK